MSGVVVPDGWEIKALKDILTIQYGKDQKEIEVESGKYPILGSGGIIGYTNHFLYNMPSVLIGRKGTINNPQYMDTPFWTVDTLFYSRIINNNIPKWVYYIFQSINWNTYNEASGVPSLSTSNINKIKVLRPSLKEQEKIAKILSTLDKNIETTNKIIEKEKNIKKALMQELLTNGIDQNNKIRSPKTHTYKQSKLGIIPKEWEVVSLGNCISNNGDYGINAPAVNFSYSLPTYLRITDIDEDGHFIDENKKSVDDLESAQYFLNNGDIVFARTGNTTGKTYLYNPKDGKLVFAGFLIRFTPNKEILVSQYLKAITETSSYWAWVETNSARTGQPGINSNEYKSYKFVLPKLEEQKQIAKILSTQDKKIESEQKNLSKLQELKKGLMSDLLSGDVRVKNG